MNRIYSILLLFVLLPFGIHGQTASGTPKAVKQKHFPGSETDRKRFEKAEYYFNELNYVEALKIYKKLEADYPNEGVILFRIGVCYINSSGDKSKSLDYLGRLDKKKFAKTDFVFYLARANHLNYRFDEAIALYTEFKQSNKWKGKEKLIDHQIENCKTGKEMYAHPTNVDIQNLGPPVNTENSEYGPTVSSDEYTLIYTYNGPRCQGGLQREPGMPDEGGQFMDDIMVSYKDSAGHWNSPNPIKEVNTDGPDAVLSLSNDGQKLLVFRNSPGDVGDIYLSKLEGKKWTEPERLPGDVNTTSYEGSASFSPDEHTLFFSSERPGGYGGRDIYSATLQADGTWGNVKNLGPRINSEYNDDSPVMTPDGQALYFHSDGHPGMGGNDIFISTLANDSVWQEPVNLGYPINTPDDDIFFYPVADGNRGYYSSGKAGGFGLQDIYVVQGLGRKNKLVMLKGTVTLDERAVDATITVTDEKKGIETQVRCNAITGKFLTNLKTGSNFKIKFKVNGYEDQVKSLSTMNVDSYLESTIDAQFFTEAFKAKLKRKTDSLSLKKDTVVNRAPAGMSLPELIAKYGDAKVDGLEFRVQVGALSLKDNFNYTGLMRYGRVQKVKGEDGITRFTIGHKSTLNEVYTLKKKVIEAGIKDAFVVAFYNKKRMSIKEVVSEKLFSGH